MKKRRDIKVKNAKSKTFVSIFLVLLLTFSAMLVLLPTISATPAWTIPTYAFIAVSPNPVGVGQSTFVMIWLDKPPPTAAGYGGDRWQHYTVEVTKPDGKVDVLGGSSGFTSDATSSTFTTYTPTMVGTYTFVFKFPGQIASLTNPDNGLPGSASDFVNDTYSASSATTTLTVQEKQLDPVPNYPLPTAYWSRPIEGQNTEWASISSNYLYPALAAYTYGAERLQPDGISPNSPHVMWTKPIQFGGIVGGTTGIGGATFYSGLSYETKFNNPIVIYGKLFYGLPRGSSGSGGGYVCVDLQTGQQVWWQNYTVNPTFGQLYLYESFNQHGVIANGYLWATSGTTWIAYDPLDGNWLFNLTDVPSGTIAYGSNGEILRYVLNYNTTANRGWLALWNNTAAPALAGATGTGSSAYQWRPVGKVVNASQAYSWNVTIPNLTNVGGSPTIRYVVADDVLLGSFGSPGGVSTANPGCTVFAISLKPSSRGTLSWIKNYPAPLGNITRQFEAVDPSTRVFTMSDKETRQWLGYSLDDGSLLWGPVGNTRAFNYYATVGSGGVSQVGYVAYGNLYTDGYGGELFCYSTKNGTLLWKYNNTNSGLDTPWGNYPLFTAAIADGKIYLFSNEHSPNVPPYKGEKVRCLNAITGEELWTMLGWAGVGGFADWGWPVADGYIVYLNTYDMQIYCIGKGPSATTVDAPLTAISKGQSLMLRGTVTDQSAGAKRLVEESKNSIVAAVSDASMSGWMEYLYMQKPKPSDTVGVTVKLTAFDPNGNSQNIGSTTTDTNGKYGISWTPSLEGTYYVIAEFEGTDSYWGSQDTTYFAVESASAQSPTASATPTQTVAPTIAPTSTVSPSSVPNTGSALGTEVYIAVAAVVVVVAVVVAALVLRKRK
jgi:hypothetical protein